MKILVCEDNPITLKTIAFTLIKSGYEVFQAEDGDQGIEILMSDEIDLVITDINMPYTKGLELVRYVNTQMESKIPVIIISGITLDETKDHARELGAAGYLTKPFDPGVLLDLIQSVVEKNIIAFMRIITALIIFLFLFSNQISSQEFQEDYSTPEDGFALMRKHAGEKQYAKAKSIGNDILTDYPEYFDVALYMARIFGWEGKYDSAYLLIDDILLKKPELLEAHEILVDLAYWENDWVKLESYAVRALELKPDDPIIKERYLLAKFRQGSKQDVPELFLYYFYDHFGLPYVRNWHMLTAGVNLPFKMGILSPYINGGYLAGGDKPATDLQLNLDSYLNFGKKNYALVGYGFSPDGIINYLPRHRVAAEIWQVLPRGYALSVGLRYFYWTRHFTFLTFSEEKYTGNYLFSFRSYLFLKEYGVSGSYYLSARRYFEDKFNHLTLTLGYGTAPDEPVLVASDLDRLKALSGRLEFSKQINGNLRLNVMTGYAYESYAEKEYRHRFDLRAGFFIRLLK